MNRYESLAAFSALVFGLVLAPITALAQADAPTSPREPVLEDDLLGPLIAALSVDP